MAEEKFLELTERSGVDVTANRAQVKVIRRLESELDGVRGKRTLLGWLTALLFIAVAIVAVFLYLNWAQLDAQPRFGGVAGGVLALALGVWTSVLFGRTGERIRELEGKIAAAKEVAWRQMEPLNGIYTWDITTRLIEATVPRLQFDPFFTAKRLRDLKRLYGWSDEFNEGKSVVFAQTGVINGNPFVFGEYRDQNWKLKTYTGRLEISWWETERDAEGRPRRVRRTQTLTGSVEKPVPVYSNRKLLIYGNDAAPNLSFSREPSGLDDRDVFDGVREKWRLHKLKKYSQNLDDESDFTLMANHRFEAWFHAQDRDDEVEFRLLFTALAQTQLMALMEDRKVGYGDDFAFVKNCRINLLRSKHLDSAPIDTAPERFRDWDYDRAFKNFRTFNEKYFKDVYFALAPLLAIPLYQQTRTHEEIWKDVLDGDGANFWEHEAIANYYGDERFRHPDCITDSILKTRVVRRADGVSDVAVTAYGYRGESRVDYVEVWGGDGNCHEVPVEWTEYLPVDRTSQMTLSESAAPRGAFAADFDRSPAALFRRSIRSFLGS